MIEKTIENYITKLRFRVNNIKTEQLGNKMHNQTMVEKELHVLENVILDLKDLENPKYNRCSYWKS